MKGIILAGGSGSRLMPLTRTTNKHLLPVGSSPMIYYPLIKLKEAGIKDIFFVTGEHTLEDFYNLLKNGEKMGLNLSYGIQEQPGGIAQALSLAEDYAAGDRIIVLLGDNIFKAGLNGYINNFLMQTKGARVLLKEVSDPQRYGIAVFEGRELISIEEKPQYPQSNMCVTGIYMYDSDVFRIIKGLKTSRQGQLEITDVNNEYIKRGQLKFDILEDWWLDAGTIESLQLASRLVMGKI